MFQAHPETLQYFHQFHDLDTPEKQKNSEALKNHAEKVSIVWLVEVKYFGQGNPAILIVPRVCVVMRMRDMQVLIRVMGHPAWWSW